MLRVFCCASIILFMSFPRFLELWAELEPDRCTFTNGMLSLRGWSLSHESNLKDRLTLSEIQSAVQDAIEHHGWNWYLGRVIIDKELYYKAQITIPFHDLDFEGRAGDIISTHSPAYVLLETYLHALISLSPELKGDSINWLYEEQE